LHPDPEQRPTLEQIKSHAWMTKEVEKPDMEHKKFVAL
jgi:hypothetical protein